MKNMILIMKVRFRWDVTEENMKNMIVMIRRRWRWEVMKESGRL